MGKRFIDVSSLPKGWRKLSSSLKLTWFYLWNHCDPSGVWDRDDELFEFENGFEIDLDGLSSYLKDLIEYDNDRVLLTNFIFVNQCEFSKLKEDYNPHKPVFRAIKKNNLSLKPSLNQASLKLTTKLVVGVEVEEEVGEVNFGKYENLLQLSDPIVLQIADYFSQTSQVQKERVCSFINRHGERFINQTLSYIEYKKASGEKIHSWLGYQTDWDSSDWADKLQKLKQITVKPSKLQKNLAVYEQAKKDLGL